MKNLLKLSSLALATTLLSGCVINLGDAQRADLEIQEQLTLNAADLNQLTIKNGAGFIDVIGTSGSDDIQVTADIVTAEHLEYELSLESKGQNAYLVATHDATMGFWVGQSPAISLTIRLPAHLALDIDDGSGDITIRNIGNNVTIDDGSGRMHLSHINGDVLIDDGSGFIEVHHVSGSLNIEDGAGDTVITNIGSDVLIDDGSGDITIEDTSGFVSVDDSSGDVTVTRVAKVVTLDDGSGDIDVSYSGGINIIESGSGSLSVNNVKGEIDIQD